MTNDRYHCPRCRDEMHVKFTRSHEIICAWVTPIHQRDVETFLDVMFP
jgi:hypothetical protein